MRDNKNQILKRDEYKYVKIECHSTRSSERAEDFLRNFVLARLLFCTLSDRSKRTTIGIVADNPGNESAMVIERSRSHNTVA
jgi:hypothetical protein